MRDWSVEDAREQVDEIVAHALAHQPQRITLGDGDAVVILSEMEFDRLAGASSIVPVLRNSLLAEALASGELVLDRSVDAGREIEF